MGGKAMIVCMSRPICYLLYQAARPTSARKRRRRCWSKPSCFARVGRGAGRFLATSRYCKSLTKSLPSPFMAKLVFDLETSALPLENFDDVQREYLFRDAEKIAGEAERLARRAEIQRLFNLWPMTARVVCIAMLNAETSRGQALFIAEDHEEHSGESGPVEFVACMDEAELLTAFWDVAKHYDSVVTFNGRGFDVPFVYLRSALLNVPISRKDWLGYRLATEPHCDLAEQFTFYG